MIDMAKVQMVHQSQIRQEVVKDHSQKREDLEHVDHPEEVQMRPGLNGQRRTGEGKSTTSFPTRVREIGLRVRRREMTVCDWRRGTRHRTAMEDAF